MASWLRAFALASVLAVPVSGMAADGSVEWSAGIGGSVAQFSNLKNGFSNGYSCGQYDQPGCSWMTKLNSGSVDIFASSIYRQGNLFFGFEASAQIWFGSYAGTKTHEIYESPLPAFVQASTSYNLTPAQEVAFYQDLIDRGVFGRQDVPLRTEFLNYYKAQSLFSPVLAMKGGFILDDWRFYGAVGAGANFTKSSMTTDYSRSLYCHDPEFSVYSTPSWNARIDIVSCGSTYSGSIEKKTWIDVFPLIKVAVGLERDLSDVTFVRGEVSHSVMFAPNGAKFSTSDIQQTQASIALGFRF